MSQWQWWQLIGFYGFWLLAVLGQQHFVWLLLLLLVVQLLVTPSRTADIKVLSLALLGWAMDGVLTGMGIFSFSEFPIWLALLWLGFVLTLGHSLAWLAARPLWQQALLGGIAGPCSYLSGWRLGAVDLPLGLGWTLAVLVPLWSLLLILLIQLDTRIRS